MKIFAFVFVMVYLSSCYAATFNDDQFAQIEANKRACVTETGIDPDLGDTWDENEADIIKSKLMCFASCMVKKIGVQNDDGTVNTDAAYEFIKKSNVDLAKFSEIFKMCKNNTGKSVCETGANISSCLNLAIFLS